MTKRTKKKLSLVLFVLALLFFLFGAISTRMGKEAAFGITYFLQDISDAKMITVYDSMHNEIYVYSNNEIHDLLSMYSTGLAVIPQNSSMYRKEVKKYVGELLYTVEVVFSEDRNDKYRDIVETLTVYAFDYESFSLKNFDDSYHSNIDGQNCVVILRNTVLVINQSVDY